ncbi:oligosaccharide flippase family protein [Psychrobacter frigidicola]|uniref:oligosaccharide flippase family protein n=1 Tax=Psychrobacter frigidicola TaxID=45611 RepID=UPI00191A472B|nr:oligosaccharide flippase family protein [Psychrobacter frigidicola]
MRKPSLKLNILASYASQIYLIVISIAILPIYIKYMGAEAYGLVGFFAMLQGLFNLLDFGLTPTISRQTAQYNAGVETALNFRRLFRALSLIFAVIAVVGGGVLLSLNEYIAANWLKLENLNINEVLFCLQVMAICVALRWMTGLYRGVISGFEQIVWLSVVNTIIATLRSPGVLLYMYYFGFTVRSFFVFQLFVAVLEFLFLAIKSYLLLPKPAAHDLIGWSLKPIKPLLSFALTITFTSSVWVLFTQLDKFVLSGILPLSDYGYFTLAVLVAGGILQLSAPISAPIMPRMARLEGEQQHEQMRQVYLNATQFIAVIVVTAGIVLAGVAKPVLYAWTGDMALAVQAAPVLRLYALGNALLALGAFPYYLQYAKGNLKYHLIGNIAGVVILVPAIIWAATHYGAIGAGWVWFLTQVIYLVFWVSFVHSKIEPNINLLWFKTFLPSLATVSIFMLLTTRWIEYSGDRPIILLKIILVSVCSVLIAMMSSIRVLNILKSRFPKRLI